MRTLFVPVVFVGLAVVVALVGGWQRSTGLSFSDLAVTPAQKGETASVYFTVSSGGLSDTIVSADSPDSGHVSLHDTNVREDGSFMVDVKAFEVPARGSLVLAPGGRHIMLHDLERQLVPGDEVEVILELETQGARTLRLPVLDYTELAELGAAGTSR